MTPPAKSSKSDQIRTLLKSGATPADIAKKVGCSLPLVYQVRTKISGGAKTKRAKSAGPAKRKGSAGDQLAQLSDIAAAVKGVEQERARMRSTLEKVQAMIADALA